MIRDPETMDDEATTWAAFFLGLLWAAREFIGYGVRRRKGGGESGAETARQIRIASDQLHEAMARDRAATLRVVTALQTRLDAAERQLDAAERQLRITGKGAD